MSFRSLAPLSLSLGLGGCLLLPDITHSTGYLSGARLEARTQAEVLGELGPPTALRADGSAFLYALPDNDWIFAFGWIAYVVIPLNPHWDVRYVGFDRRGVVMEASGKSESRASLDALVRELALSGWR